MSRDSQLNAGDRYVERICSASARGDPRRLPMWEPRRPRRTAETVGATSAISLENLTMNGHRRGLTRQPRMVASAFAPLLHAPARDELGASRPDRCLRRRSVLLIVPGSSQRRAVALCARRSLQAEGERRLRPRAAPGYGAF
jgi:hypothetical protein